MQRVWRYHNLESLKSCIKRVSCNLVSVSGCFTGRSIDPFTGFFMFLLFKFHFPRFFEEPNWENSTEGPLLQKSIDTTEC